MAATAPHVSRTRSSTSVGVICLLAGALFGLMSVYSNSRETCAVLVLVALVFRSRPDSFSAQRGR